MHRPSTVRLLLAGILLMGVGTEVVAPSTWAAAPSHKNFQATLSVDANVPGTVGPVSITVGSHDFYFTITNTSTGPQAVPYGSFQLQLPTGISLTDASVVNNPGNFNAPIQSPSTTPATVTFTSNGPTGSGIAPGSSLTVKVSGVAGSGVCPGTWLIYVKQSNDFSGSGNDFVGNNVSTPVSGGTQLVWTTQPMDTEFDKDMTTSPVVTLEDACGNSVAMTGTPTVSDSATKLKPPTIVVSGATATFNHVQFSDYGFSDTLTATLNGISATSTSFNVYQSWQMCGTGPCSTGTLDGQLNDVQAGIVTGGGTAGDVLSANIKGSASGTCNGTTTEPAVGEIVTFNINGRTKTVTMTLMKSFVLLNPNNGTPFMDICLNTSAGGTTFFDKNHYLVDPTSAPVSIGLLPDCSMIGTDGGPCITSRKKNAGNEIITFTAPAGDPTAIWH